MIQNRIRPIDSVETLIFDEGKKIDTYQGSGYHTSSEVINNAYDGSDRTPKSIEDYVFEVRNLDTGTQARYRVDAGGETRLIPE